MTSNTVVADNMADVQFNYLIIIIVIILTLKHNGD